jgi:hypothetical protein
MIAIQQADQATVNIVALAGSLPRDPQFRTWAASFIPGGDVTTDEAAEWIRVVCQVDSRRLLAEDREAEQRFHQLLRRPFIDWRNEQF